ncbi:MAG: ornithine carbamoyltransferase [Thermomicrobiales bacterium]
MEDASFATFQPVPTPAPAAPRVESPRLRSVPFTPDYSSMDADERPTLSLGGSAAKTLKIFSIGARMKGRSIVDDTDLTPDEIAEVLETAVRLKRMQRRGEAHTYLSGKTLGMIFQHPSTRTRVAFESGMAQLGGHALFLCMNDLQLRRGETIADTAKVLSRLVDVLVARVAKHTDIVELAENATVPVINGLTDRCHPCQALADMMTLQERFGALKGLKLAYLGDGNNVASSLILDGAAMGVSVTVASPVGHQPPRDILTQASWLAAASGATISVTSDPMAAVADSDAVYTDVHVSMGQVDGAARAVALAPYKVTAAVMAAAKPGAIFMHCLPMHRGEEADAEVADGAQSVIFDQAENRLHMHKALLMHLLC